MSADAQIEAVARGIRDGLRPHMYHTADNMTESTVNDMARAAIAAYEATRPAVTDEEIDALAQAIIRSIQERLGGVEEE